MAIGGSAAYLFGCRFWAGAEEEEGTLNAERLTFNAEVFGMGGQMDCKRRRRSGAPGGA